MKKIINVSDGTQKGKTTAVLKETETCTEFVNINLVYEYNVVLEDVLQKAKQFNISCATIDAKEIAKYRIALIKDEKDLVIPDMLVGILDYHRFAILESFMVWLHERKWPVRTILDEWDVYQIGYENRRLNRLRDNCIQKMMTAEWAPDILELISATNFAGVLSDIMYDDVQEIAGYEGYCGWDELQINTVPESDLIDFLNDGTLSSTLRRHLNRAWISQENILINMSHKIEDHNKIADSLSQTQWQGNSKVINHKSADSLTEIPQSNTCIIGGHSFGRSVSVPNLTTMLYYRPNLQVSAPLLQAVGRVLGPREVNPVVITTEQNRRAIEQSIDLERKIITEEVLRWTPNERHSWVIDQAKGYDENLKMFGLKSNGFKETNNPRYEVVTKEEVIGLHKADDYFKFDVSMEDWEAWEVDGKVNESWWNKYCKDAFAPMIEKQHPEPISNRTRVSIKEYLDNGYRRYVHSKNNFRKYPIMTGRIPEEPGKGFIIFHDQEQEFTANTWHHNHLGQPVRLVNKVVWRE